METAVLWKETEVHVSQRMFFSSVRICPFHPFQPVRVDLEVCQFLSENSRGCSMPVNWQFCLRCYVSFQGCTFGQPEDSNLMNWTLENYFPQAPRESTSPSKGWGSIYLGRFVYYKSIFYLKSTLDHTRELVCLSWQLVCLARWLLSEDPTFLLMILYFLMCCVSRLAWKQLFFGRKQRSMLVQGCFFLL